MRFACWITKATDVFRIPNTLLSLGNSGNANAPQCYDTHTLSLFLKLLHPVARIGGYFIASNGFQHCVSNRNGCRLEEICRLMNCEKKGRVEFDLHCKAN